MATGDNIIEVGAVIDLSQILPGLQELVAQTQATTMEMRASLEQLDAPIKVGAVAPTPESVGITPATIENLSNVSLDLDIQIKALKASIKEMVDEIVKEGGAMNVDSSWTQRLTQEKLALSLVEETQANAKKALAAAHAVLVSQEQTAMAVEEKQAGTTKEKTVADGESAAAEEKKGAAIAETSAASSGVIAQTEAQKVALQQLTIAQREYEAAAERSRSAERAFRQTTTTTPYETKKDVVSEKVAADQALIEAEQRLKLAQAEVEAAAKGEATGVAQSTQAIEANIAAKQGIVGPTQAVAAALGNEKIQSQAAANAQKELQQAELAQLAAAERLSAAQSRPVGNLTPQQVENAKELLEAQKNLEEADQRVDVANKNLAASMGQVTAADAEQVASNAEVAASSDAVTVGAVGQAAALDATGAKLNQSTILQNVAADSAKSLAVSLMAEGKSAEEAALIMAKSGISGQKVTEVFASLGTQLKSTEGATASIDTTTLKLIASQKAAGASSSDLVATMRLAGLSGRQIAAELQALGLTADQAAQVMAQMGLKVTAARNELLRMAAAAGATKEQLIELDATLKETTRSTGAFSQANAVARVEMAAFTGSTGMMAGGLARVAAASKTLGPIMQAAFPLFAVYATVTILGDVIAAFEKATDAVIGYTEEIKKANEENIKASQAAEQHAASVEDAYKRLGRTAQDQAELAGRSWLDTAAKGTEEARAQESAWLKLAGPLSSIYEIYLSIKGALKGIDDAATESAQAQKNLTALHGQLVTQLAEREKANLKLFTIEQSTTALGTTRVAQIQQELDVLSKKQTLEENIARDEAAARVIAKSAAQGAQFEAAQRVANEYALQRIEIQKKLGIATLEESLAEQRAIIDGERTTGVARVTQAERDAHEMYAAGTITLAQEVAALQVAENQKFEIERVNLEKRRAIAEAERGTGKDTTPQITAINAELQALATTHETSLIAIKTTGEEARKRLDEEFQRAVITGESRVASERATVQKESLKVLYENNSLSEAQYTKLLLENEQTRTTNIQAELSKQRDLVNQYARPDEKAAKLREADDAETVEIERHNADVAAIKAASQKRQNEDERKNVEESLTIKNEATQEDVRVKTKGVDEEIRQVDRLQSYGLISFRDRISQDVRLINSEGQKAQAILETAIASEEATRAALTGASAQEAADKKIIELKKELRRTEDDLDNKRKKAIDDLTNYEIQKNQQAYNIIASSFTSSFDKMLTEHTKFANLASGFWNQMVQGWARMGFEILAHYVQTLSQILIQEALTLLKIQTLHATHLSVQKATETLWDSFLTALGIKHSTKATTEDTAEAAAKKVAIAAEVTATTAGETAKNTAVTTGEAARTGAVTGGVAIRSEVIAGGATAAVGATIDSNISQILSDAGLAGAAAFASVIEALPFPENVATAPEVAASAVGEVTSFIGLASAEKGAVLDRDTLVAAHAKEMVLPPPISVGLQNLIGAGGLDKGPAFSEPAELSAPVASRSESNTVNNNYKTVHVRPQITVNQRGSAGDRMSHEEIASSVRIGIRKGLINV